MANWLNIVGAISGLGGAVGGILAWFSYLEHQLKSDPIYRTKVARRLTSHAYLEGYQYWLDHALLYLRRWMGDPWSWQGARRTFVVCYLFAIFYSALFFFLSWSVGGPPGLGQTEILPAYPVWRPALWLFGLGFLGILGFGVLGLALLRIRAGAVAVALAGFGAFCIGIYGGLAATRSEGLRELEIIALSGGALATLGGCVASMVIGENRATMIMTFGMLAAGTAVLVVIGVSSPSPHGLNLILFFFVLPLPNAILDWPSWWISRSLGCRFRLMSDSDSDLKPDGIPI